METDKIFEVEWAGLRFLVVNLHKDAYKAELVGKVLKYYRSNNLPYFYI